MQIYSLVYPVQQIPDQELVNSTYLGLCGSYGFYTITQLCGSNIKLATNNMKYINQLFSSHWPSGNEGPVTNEMVWLCFSETLFTIIVYGSLLIGALPWSYWTLSSVSFVFNLDSPSLQHSLETLSRQ